MADNNDIASFKLTYSNYTNGKEKNKDFTIKNNDDVMASNLIFNDKDANWYNKCNRYGWIDVHNHDRVVREYLFFTKPDLCIFNNSPPCLGNLNSSIQYNDTIRDMAARMPYAIAQLQKSVYNSNKIFVPFMYIFTNAAASKLDLPGITAESQECTPNIYGTSIQYRSHSYKSDNGYDFSLTFNDTAYLEIYNIVKCYDEYMRMAKLGEIEFSQNYKDNYIKNHIIPEYFSIYKFLVGSDGETILYYAKLTGCYFTDVPRADLSDPAEILKYSISFHAEFVEDMNPEIITEFNMVTKGTSGRYLSVFSPTLGAVNNRWSSGPKIISHTANDGSNYSKRIARRGVNHDYYLKWLE